MFLSKKTSDLVNLSDQTTTMAGSIFLWRKSYSYRSSPVQFYQLHIICTISTLYSVASSGKLQTNHTAPSLWTLIHIHIQNLMLLTALLFRATNSKTNKKKLRFDIDCIPTRFRARCRWVRGCGYGLSQQGFIFQSFFLLCWSDLSS